MVRGLVVGLANPKMLIFFLAFFPQFIDPSRGPASGQVLVLGAVFWVLGTGWDLGIALTAGAIGSRLRHRTDRASSLRRVEGVAYLGLAGWVLASV